MAFWVGVAVVMTAGSTVTGNVHNTDGPSGF
jgi:hypothetical protein